MPPVDNAAEAFELERPRLRAVATRILGSTSEAEDAVQEAWFRLDRAGTSEIANLGAWLTVVVSRIALDQVRTRTSTPGRNDRLPDRQLIASQHIGGIVGDLRGVGLRSAGACARPLVSTGIGGLHSSRPVSIAVRRGRDDHRSLSRRNPQARQPGTAKGGRRRVRAASRPTRSHYAIIDAFLIAARRAEISMG